MPFVGTRKGLLANTTRSYDQHGTFLFNSRHVMMAIKTCQFLSKNTELLIFFTTLFRYSILQVFDNKINTIITKNTPKTSLGLSEARFLLLYGINSVIFFT